MQSLSSGAPSSSSIFCATKTCASSITGLPDAPLEHTPKTWWRAWVAARVMAAGRVSLMMAPNWQTSASLRLMVTLFAEMIMGEICSHGQCKFIGWGTCGRKLRVACCKNLVPFGMELLPSDVYSRIVGNLDAASSLALALTNKTGREMVRGGRATACIPWGGDISSIAAAPSSVRVVIPAGEEMPENRSLDWLFSQWPPSAKSLEWHLPTISLAANEFVGLSQTPPHLAIQEQSVLCHSLVIPPVLPESLTTIKAVWLENSECEWLGADLPFVREVCMSTSSFIFKPLTVIERFFRLRRLTLKNMAVAFTGMGTGELLDSLDCLTQIEEICLESYPPTPFIKPLPGSFPHLHTLKVRPWLQDIRVQSGHPPWNVAELRHLPSLKTLEVSGHCEWGQFAEAELDRLACDIDFSPSMVFLSQSVYPKAKQVLSLSAQHISCSTPMLAAHLDLMADQVFNIPTLLESQTLRSFVMPASPYNLAGLGRSLPEGWSMRMMEVDGRRCVEARM